MKKIIIFKTGTDKKPITPSSRCRTATASARERSEKIDLEITKANQTRLVKEVERNSFSFEKPKPASFYINKAREKFNKKNKGKDCLFTFENRGKVFGPMLSTQIIKSAEKVKNAAKSQRTIDDIIRESINGDNFLPDWLAERPDYQAIIVDGNISDICATPLNNRTEAEKMMFIKWLTSARFFNKLANRVIKDTCDKLIRVKFKENDTIIKKGDVGDCLYIIYSGKAKIQLEPDIIHDIIGAKSVIGEHALDTNKKRTASVIALEPIIAFKLTKTDYDQILLNIKKLEKYKSSKLLMSIPFFRNWSYLKVQHLSNFLIKKVYPKGEILYDKGDNSDTFYIIKKGQIDIQAYVEMQHINRWPTGCKQWKILEINKKYIVTIASLKRGSYFGETTMIEQIPRTYRAICVMDTICLTINKDEFFENFSVKDLEILQENTYVHIPKEKDLQKKLIQEMDEKVSNEKAIYDSMEVDFNNPDGRESLLDNKTKKLRNWIFDLKKRIKDNTTEMNKRVVSQNKKSISIDSIVMLNSFCSDIKKTKVK
ncbi:hypothetical protein SteCoe_11203 [Stentor coeruleus]|uniref:Cyclic nucleotide-binding domain-containing protein n=1 Tax=Stentor coeruleus TaxID=5963 RepID=A0A1R2CDN9_9CILI|nr:hypothetical protein SteCoe_11203 [Stentor coeruleus]